jgi:hypothetical protein
MAYDPLNDVPPISSQVHPDTYDPLSDQPNRTMVRDPSDDTLPGRTPILKTSFHAVPRADAPKGELWGGSFAGVPTDDAPTRIRQAISDAYQNAPNLLTPQAEDWAKQNLGWFGRNVVPTVSQAVGAGVGDVAAVGAGIGQTFNELARTSGIVPPNLQRDINLGVPLAAAVVPALKTLDFTPRMPAPVPRIAGGVADTELQTALQREALRKSGVLVGDTPAAPGSPSSPTGILGTMPPPEGYVPGKRVFDPPLGTADAVKEVANVAYKRADALGGTAVPEVTDKFLDRLSKMPKQTEGGQIFAGPDPVTGLIQDAQALRGKPLTLQTIQEMDEGLGDRITAQYDQINGMSPEGRRLLQVQRELRDTVANLGPGDVSGGTAGFDALKQGREAYAQFAKMRDLERMQAKANEMTNPTQSFRTMVSNYDTRGWSDAEKAALDDAKKRGSLGNLLYAFGGRLGKYVGAGIGAASPLGPVVGTGVGMGVAEGAGASARSLINNAMNKRIADALATLSRSVPAPADAGGTIVVPR